MKEINTVTHYHPSIQRANRVLYGKSRNLQPQWAKPDKATKGVFSTQSPISSILHAGEQEAIEQHTAPLKATIAEVDQYKRTWEAVKIAEKQELDDITKWVEDNSTKVAEADTQFEQTQEWLAIQKRKTNELFHA